MENLPIRLADTFGSRFKGLMFVPEVNEALWITPCNSIHMFFMKTSIDVLFLDASQQIISVKEKVKPWRLVLPVKHAKSVVELPPGFVERNEVTPGSRVSIQKGFLHVDEA
jgi:uncharacterized protein